MTEVRPWDLFTAYRADSDSIEHRMKICRECDRFIKVTAQCKECGCFMKGKTLLAEAECPLSKWGPVEAVEED